MMTASEILQKHEDDNEMHLHHVDRKWVIEAMEEYAEQQVKATVKYYTGESIEQYAKDKSGKPIIPEISDEEIENEAYRYDENQAVSDWRNASTYGDFIEGAKWYREQLKKNN